MSSGGASQALLLLLKLRSAHPVCSVRRCISTLLGQSVIQGAGCRAAATCTARRQTLLLILSSGTNSGRNFLTLLTKKLAGRVEIQCSCIQPSERLDNKDPS